MKSAIPWVLIFVLLGGVYFLYDANKAKDAELAKQTQDLQELDNLRSENQELKKQAGQAEDLVRLRKENEDLLRMRSEAQRLRTENKQLNARLSAAQAQGAQAQQARQQAATENEALRTQTQQLQQTQTLEVVKQQTDACINILRQIDGAKQQWALENKKAPTDVPTAEDITPYFGRGTAPPPLACPAGGTYSINAISDPPTCTIPGHALK